MLDPTDSCLCQHLTHFSADDLITETFKVSPSKMLHSETIKKKCISETYFSINLKSLESRISFIDASKEPFITPAVLASSIL